MEEFKTARDGSFTNTPKGILGLPKVEYCSECNYPKNTIDGVYQIQCACEIDAWEEKRKMENAKEQDATRSLRDVLSKEELKILGWKNKRPTIEGFYLHKNPHNAVIFGKVAKGNWEQTQNPEWFYFRGKKLDSYIEKNWYGPIPKPEGEINYK